MRWKGGMSKISIYKFWAIKVEHMVMYTIIMYILLMTIKIHLHIVDADRLIFSRTEPYR